MSEEDKDKIKRTYEKLNSWLVSRLQQPLEQIIELMKKS